MGAVDPAEQNGVARRDGVERAPVDRHRRGSRPAHRVGLPGSGGTDVATGDPESLRQAARHRRDRIRDLVWLTQLVDTDAERPRRGVAEVRVRVDETRKYQTAGEVDHLRARAMERESIR